MSNAKTFQEWAKEILSVVQAAANGAVIEVKQCGVWREKCYNDLSCDYSYRVKPKTIRIGEYDVPEPLRGTPMNGEPVYLVCTDRAVPVKLQWYPTEYALQLLDSGLFHREHTGAELHLKALLSLTKVGA